jgi:hypothetical protein
MQDQLSSKVRGPAFGLSLRLPVGLTHLPDSNSITATGDSPGKDTEPDDDDGSTTVTNSTANLADLPIRPTPAEVLAAKLECVTAALVEEAKSLPKPPAEEPSVNIPPSDYSTAGLPSHDELHMDLPYDYEPAAELGTTTQEPTVEEISVNVCTPSEPSSGATDMPTDPVCGDEVDAASTDLKEGEAQVEVDLSSQDDSDVEPWTPDYEIPIITITPPSEVDPEDFAQQLDSEDEQGEPENIVGPDFEDKLEPGSEHDDESELEYADDYPNNPATEVILELPPSPVEVRDDPCRSPITKTGKLWSDDEGGDLDPLPSFEGVTHVEVYDDLESPTLEKVEIAEHSEAIHTVRHAGARCSPVEEETPDTVSSTFDDLNSTCPIHPLPPKNGLIELPPAENHVTEATQQPTKGPQWDPEAPAQKVIDLVPSTTRSSSLRNPPHASRSKRTRMQAPSDNGDRGEGSRDGETLEIPRLRYYHCCNLYRSDGRPKSWENWKMEKPVDCIPKKTNLQEWQFVRPTDKDGENPTTRIAIDNMDADRFQKVDGVLSYNYLTDAMGFFSTKSYRCWRGRSINGVEHSSIGYATVDLDSVGEAIRMFDELQGRRLKGHTWHWRLEFVDPSDETHGDRRAVRVELVPDSVKQALAAELEASTRRNGRPGRSEDTSNGTAGVTRPPAKVRPQISIGGRSLFTGAMSNAVKGRRTGEQAAQSTRVPSQRPYRS